MDISEVLAHIFVVLLAAKLAAEAAERISVPPVLGEIVAGIILGPSMLGLVGNDEVLRVLGELGVIFLLLQVGLEMDLRELRAVGRASLTVATVGVIVPFAGGIGVSYAFGLGGDEALFIGAALTATSVGITARVFGDLRALASVEARTVLGAAVADDVIGLVILTVVTRIVSDGTVSVLGVVWILVVALGFLIIATAAGLWLVPPIFAAVSRHSRSGGTLVGLALAFTLGIAVLADKAQLAPIVGAFVAGLVLARCTSAERIQRELRPIGHFLIPVFFLQIGIDTDVGQFANPYVLAVAATLLTVAVLGKLAASAGMFGSVGDRLLVGIGMIPRGEVGLIFATLGLRQGVFGEDVYAALLLVVLATTLGTPPALRARLLQLRKRRQPHLAAGAARPPEGWLVEAGDRIELVAEPPPGRVLEVALDVAIRCAETAPGESVMGWFADLPSGPLRWTGPDRERFFDLLERGSARSWRLLIITGVLERALPELGRAAERRGQAELDPLASLHWSTLARVRMSAPAGAEPRERVLLAALILDVTGDDGGTSPVVVARKTCQRLDLGAATEQAVAGLVGDRALLLGASRRLDGLGEESVLQLAAHLGTAAQTDALFALSEAYDDLGTQDRARLSVLHGLVGRVLAHPELVSRTASNTVEQRRAQAARLVGTDAVARERIEHAPRAYLLRVAPEDIARQVASCDPIPAAGEVRVRVSAPRPDACSIDVVARDRPGLLAHETAVLVNLGLDVEDAVAATWGDRCALASFQARCAVVPDEDGLVRAIQAALAEPLASSPLDAVTLEFDHDASPWHTLCTARASDSRGLLNGLTSAFAATGANVHAAQVHHERGTVVGIFQLTNSKGHKLERDVEERVVELLRTGVTEPARRRFLLRWRQPPWRAVPA